MRFAVLLLLLGVAASPTPGHALDRSECKQYGGSANCWMPVIGDWKHSVCGKVGTFQSYSIAECQAQGGTWGGSQIGCQGLPTPEYWRPTSEADMRPFAEDIFAAFHGPLCEGSVSESFSWGGVYSSVNCGNGNGPGFTFGYPDGTRRTYLYNEPEFLDQTISGQRNTYDGRLTDLVDENEVRFGSYYYDIFGIAKRSTQPDGVNNTVVNAGSWPGSIIVTDARGAARTYGYQSINGAYRNTSIAQPAVSGTGTVQSMRSYDANSNVAIRRDFNGNRTNYTYDLSRNLETSRTEALTSAGAATPQTRTISTYDPGREHVDDRSRYRVDGVLNSFSVKGAHAL